MATLQNTTIDDTEFVIPTGSSGTRPAAEEGIIRFNTDIGKLETYNNNAEIWVPAASKGVVATGGTIFDTTVEGTKYRVHVFHNTGTSTFSVARGGEIEYLIVAGGGASGSGDRVGGGGAGGLIIGNETVTDQTSYPISVGAGGTGDTNGQGNNGNNTTAFGLTALGGGGGGSSSNGTTIYNEGKDGGSGGGAGNGRTYRDNVSATMPAGSATQPGSASGGFGNDGGNSRYEPNYGGGGGGGAGGPGESTESRDSWHAGVGGIGYLTNIIGYNTFYAGGGGGAWYGNQNNGGKGGPGGGGSSGDQAANGNGTSGGKATGGGSGGRGAQGGSGVVVVRYPLHTDNPNDPDFEEPTDGLLLDLDFSKTSVYAGDLQDIGNYTISDSRGIGRGIARNGIIFSRSKSTAATAHFNGTNQYIEYPHNPVRPVYGITLESWIKFDVANTSQVIIGSQQGTSSGNHYALWVTGTNQWNGGCNTTDSSFSTYQLTATRSTGVWYHFVYTFNGSQEALYLNNNLLGSRTKTGTLTYDRRNTLLALGGDYNGSGYNSGIGTYVNGEVGYFRIWSRGLTATEISKIYNRHSWRFGD